MIFTKSFWVRKDSIPVLWWFQCQLAYYESLLAADRVNCIMQSEV